MNDNLAYKINSSFRLLGLKPGADARQIRSAFRRLARTYHPDVSGVFNTKKFEQISNAYLLLKNLTPEELALCEVKTAAAEPEIAGESFFAKWKRTRAEKEAKREADARARREAGEAEREARERALSERVDAILDKCAREINSAHKRKQDEKQSREISDIIIRIEASRYEVRLMALQNISKYLNSARVLESLLNTLGKYPVTGEILDLMDRLQLPHDFMRKVIEIVAKNVNNLNEQEAFQFIRKTIFMTAGSKNVISSFMEHPSLKITEFLLARWTFKELPAENALKRIFADIQNDKLIISALNMLKKYDKRSYPGWLTQKIKELQTHENASVRLWARVVSSEENVVK